MEVVAIDSRGRRLTLNLEKLFGSHPFFLKNLRVQNYFKSLERDETLKNGEVVCIMCTYDEGALVNLAIESSFPFVDRYILIDKTGSTLAHLTPREKVEAYVKPDLNLREAREFALTLIGDAPWVLVQDGDEIFRENIVDLREYMNRRNVVYCARLIQLIHDFDHAPLSPLMSSHPFLFHNNGTLRVLPAPKNQYEADSWYIGLPHVYKFNCTFKPWKTLSHWTARRYDPEQWVEYPYLIKQRKRRENV